MGHDISQVAESVFISAWPESQHVDEILALNIRLVLSMHWMRPSRALGRPPLRLLWLPTFDSPLAPMPMAFLHRGVEAALPVIQEGYGVLAHCGYGIHRSVAMTCCVLIGTGLRADEAMELVKTQRPVADPYARHIQARIRKFEREWQEK